MGDSGNCRSFRTFAGPCVPMLSDDVMPPLPVCDMRMGASYDMAPSQNNDLFADREKPIERFLVQPNFLDALCSQLGAVREKTLGLALVVSHGAQPSQCARLARGSP